MDYVKTMSPIRFTNMLFDFIHLSVSHLSYAALPSASAKNTRVSSVYNILTKGNIVLNKSKCCTCDTYIVNERV